MSIVYLREPTEYKTTARLNLEHQMGTVKKRRIKHSKGEIFLGRVLDKLQLQYIREFSLQSIPKLRFDFCLQEKKILLEWDSQIHFKFCKFIHKTEGKFIKAQQRDCLKTNEAIESGYLIIRIDYNYLDNFEQVTDFIQRVISQWDGNGKFIQFIG